MIGNTKLYLAPRSHGSPLMGACAPVMGGWWTDLWNAVEKAGSVVIPGYTAVTTAQAKAEAIKAGTAATSSTPDPDYTKIALIAGGVLLAAMLLKKA